MSNAPVIRHVPVFVSLVISLMLAMMPLPDAIESFRPDWVALLVIFWAMSLPGSYNVGVAWVAGILLDVSQGTLLGQHALALCAITYITVRFHLLIRVFPLLQLTATVFALLALYQFLLFWINGVAGVSAPMIVYWAPVISGAVIWPFLHVFMARIRYRAQLRG